MREKSFLEILSQRIEKDLRKELFPSENRVFSSEKMSQNTKNVTFPSEKCRLSSENCLKNPWMSPVSKAEMRFSETTKHHLKQNLHRFYPRTTTTPPSEKRKTHELTEDQNLAWNYFLMWKTGLNLDFTEKELKGAFRKLAQKLHPDKNAGLSTYYLELKKNYEILTQVFKVSSK
ncbi:MAG: DnaJ domain-containing protein [Bdellovibrionales bacterium]